MCFSEIFLAIMAKFLPIFLIVRRWRLQTSGENVKNEQVFMKSLTPLGCDNGRGPDTANMRCKLQNASKLVSRGLGSRLHRTFEKSKSKCIMHRSTRRRINASLGFLFPRSRSSFTLSANSSSAYGYDPCTVSFKVLTPLVCRYNGWIMTFLKAQPLPRSRSECRVGQMFLEGRGRSTTDQQKSCFARKSGRSL